MTNWMDFFPTVWNLPLGGPTTVSPVTSWLSPQYVINYKGDPRIEQEIITGIAGYGSQLGTIIDALIEIAGKANGPAVAKLKTLAADIAVVKERRQADCAERARKALEELKSRDGAAFRALMASMAAGAAANGRHGRDLSGAG